jgi:AraC family transcriptional regulator
MENIYKSRINKAIDYIESNLENAFTLEELAKEAGFSKFHFSRIFKALVGETPFQFIVRIRLEKAAALLTMKSRESITGIAFTCGFTDISVFSRNFKSYFKKSATQYRNEKSNLNQADSNTQQTGNTTSMYFCHDLQTIKWRTTMKLNKSVEVRELPKMTVAYIRHTGPYKGDEKLFEKLWGKLCTWAGANDLMRQPDLKFLTVYHDDPKITVDEKLRISVCVTVPPGTKVDGEFGKMEIEGGKYVIARFELTANDFMEAWDWVYGHWLPVSGYQPDDRPCFELFPREPENGKFVVDICVPIKPV